MIEIDWDKIEELCVDLAADCLPKNIREWSYFIEMYENALKYYNGEGHDFSKKDMTVDEHAILFNKYIYLGRTFKRSPFECFKDLNNKDKKIFEGVNWTAIKLVNRIWCGWNINLFGLSLKTIPKCPEYVGGSFACDNNLLKTLQGAPQHVGRNFYCPSNRLTTLQGGPQHVGGYFNCKKNQLTTLQGAPQHVGGNFYCENNKLTKSIPTGFVGKDLPKYIDLKESIILNFKDFKKFNESNNSEKQYDVIESRFVYSTYCPIWFTGSEDACCRFIVNIEKSDPSTKLELREKKPIE